MIADACRHRWRLAFEAHVRPGEVVVHEMKGDGVAQVFHLLTKGIGQAGEPAHPHPHREILALNVGGGHMSRVRVALDASGIGANARCRTVPLLAAWLCPVQLDELGVVNIGAEHIFHCLEVGLVAVRGQLNAGAQTRGEIADEGDCRSSITPSEHPHRHQFGIRINGRPRPHVTVTENPLVFRGNVLVFGMAERPDFIGLHALAGQITHGLIHVDGADRAQVAQQLGDRILGNAGHANCGTDGVTFHQAGDNAGAALTVQLVHTDHYT